MIKTAAIFPDQSARNSGPVLAAVAQSLEQAGVKIVVNSLTADAVILWSVLWAGRMVRNREIYEHYRNQARKVIVVDIGCVQRGTTWKIALDNINRQGWFGEGDLDHDRPAKLGMLRPKSSPGSQILIAAQHRGSAQALSIADMEAWALDRVSDIRRFSDRPIVIRSHPRDTLRLKLLPDGVILQRPRPLLGTYDSFDWSDSWHAVVNHNSGPGVLAGIAGVRPVVDPTSLAWPIAVNMADIERPYETDRSRWLIEIAHTEYTLDEIYQGIWLKRLGSRL